MNWDDIPGTIDIEDENGEVWCENVALSEGVRRVILAKMRRDHQSWQTTLRRMIVRGTMRLGHDRSV